MCGIAGIRSFGGASAEGLRARAGAMAGSLRHRGPDGNGVWVDAAAGVAFGFRRLAIIDPTPAGDQPMTSASGRYTIVFNGEVYNHRELRRELGDAPLRGHSDTEILLACIEAWGLPRALDASIGMFAIALWDSAGRELHLVRDRAGVKPLVVARIGRDVLFASDLRALETDPEFPREVDQIAVDLYARYGFVPAPRTIYRAAAKIEPGTVLTIRQDGSETVSRYWDPVTVAESAAPFRGSEDEALEVLETLLSDAVRLRMISDVPLGVFLSGGVDSALVTAYMRRSAPDVKSFTIGFDDPSLDESAEAAAIAAHLGTNHHHLHASVAEAQGVIPMLATIYDEPFADTSAIPTYLVSRMARRQVTVALSGDGGDELFGGYHRHFLGRRVWERAARVPRPARPAAAALARRRGTPRMLRYAAALTGDADALYDLDLGSDAFGRSSRLEGRRPRIADPTKRGMFADFVTFLPDDILVKVDRATMAVSMEGREPLLDHRLVQFAWSLPAEMLVGAGEGKRLLRRLLRRVLPDRLIGAEKKGFGLEVGEWLRGPLREWAESLLPGDGRYLDRDVIARLWLEHRRGAAVSGPLWRALMLEAWRAERRL